MFEADHDAGRGSVANTVAQALADQIHQVNRQVRSERHLNVFGDVHLNLCVGAAARSLHERFQRGGEGFAAGQLGLQA